LEGWPQYGHLYGRKIKGTLSITYV